MNVKDYNSRRSEILRLLVNLYIKAVSPVSSRAISRVSRLGYSPATIRNIMSDLKEDGYITQPHTSAGSIPTDKGYRYYVDCLMEAENLSEEERRMVKSECLAHVKELEKLVQLSSRILSSLTNYTSFAILPSLSRARFRTLELINLGTGKLLALLITNTNSSRTSIIDMDEDITIAESNRIKNFLNQELTGVAMGELKLHLRRKFLERTERVLLFDKALKIIEFTQATGEKGQVHLEGLSFILSQPEFSHNLARTKLILATLESGEEFQNLLRDLDITDELLVRIGKENPRRTMSDCSIVLKRYYSGDAVSGIIGLIGPRRLRYARAISAVRYLAEHISP